MTRVEVEAVGPTGQFDRLGRSVDLPVPPTAPFFFQWAALGLLLSDARACLVLTGFGVVLGLHLVQMSLNHRSDIFCDFMSGQSVLATCILAQKHNLHFLEGEVWFRNFIGYRCV